MTLNPPTYIYVGTTPLEHVPGVADPKKHVHITTVPDMRELFVTLNDRSITDLKLLIDVSQMSLLQGLGVVEVCQTISTLVDSHRVTSGMRLKRTPVSVAVRADTDVSILRELVSSNIQTICPTGEGTDALEQDIAISKWMEGVPYIPQSVKNKLYPPITRREKSSQLTPRQTQILHLIVTRGADNKTLAKITNLSVGTIKLHLSAIFKKYGVRTRSQLIIAAKNDV